MMQNLPTAEVYERENAYMPWGVLIKEVQEIVLKRLPQNGTILDLLCGPGYLLRQLQKQRPDLRMTGVDLESEYIEYAKKQYQDMEFIVGDAITWQPPHKYDAVLVTGGLHHLRYEHQERFLKNVAGFIKDSGFAIIADPYIDDYQDEHSRKLASAKLGYEYLMATLKSHAPDDILDATIGILKNDVLGVEYKNSLQKTRGTFEKYFATVETHKTWPKEDTGYGDYYFILNPKT